MMFGRNWAEMRFLRFILLPLLTAMQDPFHRAGLRSKFLNDDGKNDSALRIELRGLQRGVAQNESMCGLQE